VHITEFLLHIYLGITGHQPIKTCNIVQAYVSLTHRGGGAKRCGGTCTPCILLRRRPR